MTNQLHAVTGSKRERKDVVYDDKTAGLTKLGYNVMWTLSGLRVSSKDLTLAMLSWGFTGFIPPPPAPSKTVRRAIGEWLRHTPAALRDPAALNGASVALDPAAFDGKVKTLVRGIKESGGNDLVYGIVQEKIDLAKLGLSYSVDLRVVVDQRRNQVQVCTMTTTTGGEEQLTEVPTLTMALMPYWLQYSDVFLGYDLTPMLTNIMLDRHMLNAVATREYGGLYFVPYKNRDMLLRLRDMISEMPPVGGNHFISCVPIIDVEDSAAEMGRLIHMGLLAEIERAATELKELLDSGRSIREATLRDRILEFQELKEKAGLYNFLLTAQQDQVVAQVEELELSVFEFMTGTKVIPDDTSAQVTMDLSVE